MKANLLFILCIFFACSLMAQKTEAPPVSKKQAVWKTQRIETNQKQVSTRIQHYKLTSSEEWRKANAVPETFPRYKDTGNANQDLRNYFAQKNLWIKENPGEYEKIKHLSL